MNKPNDGHQQEDGARHQTEGVFLLSCLPPTLAISQLLEEEFFF